METLTLPHLVKFYECDRKKQFRLHCLFNLFQEAADLHADALGVGYGFCKTNGIGWVGANYHVKIDRLPLWGERINVTTWASDRTAVSGIRDFKAETESGELLFFASSQWALISLETLRPVAVAKNLPDYTRHAERMINTTFPAIPLPEHEDSTSPFAIRYDDIDINDHVNNAVYPLWASESVPHDFRLTHEIAEMEIAFKKPAVFSDTVTVFTQTDGLTTTHRIASPDKTKDFARVRINWKNS